MWTVGVFLLCTVLCKSSLGISHEMVKRDVDGVKTKFTDLNGDVIVDILNHFEFMNLLKVTETMPWLSTYAAEVIRRRNYEIEINRSNSNDGSITDDGRLMLGKAETILSVLKHFGSGIQHLNIENRWTDSNDSDINLAINQYTSDSLKIFQLFNIKERSFEAFTIPFTKLEELKIVVPQIKGPVRLPMSLNELFPNLKRIYVAVYADIDFMDCEFPNLEQVTLSFENIEWHQLDRLKGFIAKNPQVRSTILWRSPKGTFKRIHKHWPNLVNLTVEIKEIGDHAIHFNDLKYLHFRSHFNVDFYPINKISSSSLETLRMEYSTKFGDQWMEFIDKHNGVRHLIADVTWTETEPGLAELTTRMHNLAEVTVYAFNSIKIETIERIIQTHDKLLKFQLEPDYFPSYSNTDGKTLLEEKFGNEYNVETYTFKRGYSKRTGYLLAKKHLEQEE